MSTASELAATSEALAYILETLDAHQDNHDFFEIMNVRANWHRAIPRVYIAVSIWDGTIDYEFPADEALVAIDEDEVGGVILHYDDPDFVYVKDEDDQ